MTYAIEDIAPLIKEWTINTRLPEVVEEMTRRYYYRMLIEQNELSKQAEIYKCRNDPIHWFNHWVNPTHAEYIGTITSVKHPEYRVQIEGGSGPVLCTSGTTYGLGARVFIANQVILRPAPSGSHSEIEV